MEDPQPIRGGRSHRMQRRANPGLATTLERGHDPQCRTSG